MSYYIGSGTKGHSLRTCTDEGYRFACNRTARRRSVLWSNEATTCKPCVKADEADKARILAEATPQQAAQIIAADDLYDRARSLGYTMDGAAAVSDCWVNYAGVEDPCAKHPGHSQSRDSQGFTIDGCEACIVIKLSDDAGYVSVVETKPVDVPTPAELADALSGGVFKVKSSRIVTPVIDSQATLVEREAPIREQYRKLSGGAL